MTEGEPETGSRRMFDAYLARWGLAPDGAPITTHSSSLLPVRRDGLPAMLKVAHGRRSAPARG